MGIRFEDYKEEPKNENLGEDEFISRLDGSIQKKNIKTINEYMRDGEDFPPELSDAISKFGELFRENERKDEGMVKYLYNEWRFPKNIIDLVFHEFGESFDESHEFLILMDGSDGDTDQEMMRNAWDSYVDEYDVCGGPSTDEFAEFIYE